MKPKLKNELLLAGFLSTGFFLVSLFFAGKIFAGNPDYQRCKTNSTCIIGEFLYDDNYQPIADATCTLTSRNPSGEVFLNAVSMTAASDGWYSYSLDTTGQTEGLYRSQMCCTTGTDYLCLDKSFYIGPSFLSTSDVAGAVWNAQPTGYQTADTFGANLQNPVLTAVEIWGYSSRTLSSFGSLIAEIWSYSSRSLTTFGTLVSDIWNSATRTLTGAGLTSGELATKTVIESATQSAVLSIKTSNDYDLGDILGYVDTLETSVGTATDTSSTSTLFGKIKGVKDTVDQLSTIDTNIDSLVSKWGSYDAEDIYDKVKNLSSDISAVNAVSNVSSILNLAQNDATNMTDLKNKVAAMKAVVDVNRTLLEKVSNQPIIKTWLEEGSIIFKTLITNPSKIASQKVPLKYYLPKELTKEDIIKLDEGLKIDYDASEEAWYVSGEFELTPEETKFLSVEAVDIWKISEDEVASLRKQTEELSKPLKGTSYFAQGTLVKSDIEASLDKVLRLQKEATTPQARIRAYREGVAEIKLVQGKLETLKTLVASAGSMGTMFGFIGGVQTLGVWGLIIVLIAGFVFLGIYTRRLNPPSTNIPDIKLENETERNLNLEPPRKNLFRQKLITIILIGTMSAFLSFFVGFFFINKNKNILVKEPEISPIPTPASIPLPKEENKENQEIQINEEKQVLGTEDKQNLKVKVIVGEESVNIRKEPSLEAEILGGFNKTEEVFKLDEVTDWIKIKVNIKRGGIEYTEGWVNKMCIEE